MRWLVLAGMLTLALPTLAPGAPKSETTRLRVIVETDAGGDPDDEQSLVRFLLYTNEWDVEGIIANRPVAIDGENKNLERTGLGIVRRQLRAYAECYPNLVRHDPRYPKPETLFQRTVAGYADTREAEELIRRAVESSDPRPVWFLNWGTNEGSAPSNLKRVLDQELRERGPAAYARFKNRLRLSSSDEFGEHTTTIAPPWRLWVDTFRPEIDRKRWYHRFSAVTATAGGFDLRRDVLTGHGPLGALYPTNTTHTQKEGDSMTFMYLIPTGMNDPKHPEWGSWAGRYGLNPEQPGRAYYWANQEDTWHGTTSRENTLARWAEALQNDFRARMDWCVRPYAEANHPPVPRLRGSQRRKAKAGERIVLDARGTTDPDGDTLRREWIFYPEPSTYRGEVEIRDATGDRASFIAPRVTREETLHFVLSVTDGGSPPLTRYRRVLVTVSP
jgi:hypothetical protein